MCVIPNVNGEFLYIIIFSVVFGGFFFFIFSFPRPVSLLLSNFVLIYYNFQCRFQQRMLHAFRMHSPIYSMQREMNMCRIIHATNNMNRKIHVDKETNAVFVAVVAIARCLSTALILTKKKLCCCLDIVIGSVYALAVGCVKSSDLCPAESCITRPNSKQQKKKYCEGTHTHNQKNFSKFAIQCKKMNGIEKLY